MTPEEIVTNHFGKDVDVYTFADTKNKVQELLIPVNYIVVQDTVYFTSDSSSSDPRVTLFLPKE